MKEETLHDIECKLKNYRDWQFRTRQVLDGDVDMTIHGWYIGDKITPDQKETLKTIALRFCAGEMWEIRCELALLGNPFIDNVNNVLELMDRLRERHAE